MHNLAGVQISRLDQGGTRMRHWMSLATLLILACGLSAQAAEDMASDLNLNLGLAVPVGSTGDFFKKSFDMDLSYLKKVHAIASVGGEIGYLFGSKFEGTIPGRLIGDLDADGIPDPVDFTSDISAKVLH